MACFVVPAAEAVIATVAVQIAKSMKFHRRSLNVSCLRALSRLLSIKFRFQESFLGFAIYFGAVFYFLPLNTFGTES